MDIHKLFRGDSRQTLPEAWEEAFDIVVTPQIALYIYSTRDRSINTRRSRA
jgi:hypothetical protein